MMPAQGMSTAHTVSFCYHYYLFPFLSTYSQFDLDFGKVEFGSLYHEKYVPFMGMSPNLIEKPTVKKHV